MDFSIASDSSKVMGALINLAALQLSSKMLSAYHRAFTQSGRVGELEKDLEDIKGTQDVSRELVPELEKLGQSVDLVDLGDKEAQTKLIKAQLRLLKKTVQAQPVLWRELVPYIEPEVEQGGVSLSKLEEIVRSHSRDATGTTRMYTELLQQAREDYNAGRISVPMKRSSVGSVAQDKVIKRRV